MTESGEVSRKSIRGETTDCPIVALVDISAFGEEPGELEVVVKSLVPVDLFCDEVHPGGSPGGTEESKSSTNGNVVLTSDGGR
jgi:hypothetical protein